MIGQTWYRYGSLRSDSEPSDCVYLSEYEVVGETEHMVTIRLVATVYPNARVPAYFRENTRRVLKVARKRWAYPTKELALDSFKRRKQFQEWHAQNNLDHARACLALVATVEGML